MLSFLKKFILYLQTKRYFWIEEKKVRNISKRCPEFQQIDRALKRKYLFKNPYHISKKYLEQIKASEIYAYGETPITTMLQIVKECELSSEDRIIEMGAGRGRAALFLATYVKCEVMAYEQIPSFVSAAKEVAEKSKCHSFDMQCIDMFQADVSKASVIYLYGTMLSDQEIQQWIKKIPLKVKMITVSYPLNDYSPDFQTIKTFPGSFPWGETTIYWNEKI